MAGGFVLVIFLMFVVFVVASRLVAGSWDRTRIADDVRARGGQVVSIQWSPFGRGWWGEKGDRIYEVWYDDARGRRRNRSVKTSAWSGVYWTDDGDGDAWADAGPEPPASPAPAADPGDADELARLRQENAVLRQRLRQRR